MKLERILDQLNSLEKQSFLKTIAAIIEKHAEKNKEIEQVLNDPAKDIKKADNILITRIFKLIENEFIDYIKEELNDTTSQLDILIDIIVRDGNCIMSREWFNTLYEKEIKSLKKKISVFNKELENPKSEITERRKRDYKIYRACLEIAYENDVKRNQDKKITTDEQDIITALFKQLGLSHEEVKLINYDIIGIKQFNLDETIKVLTSYGIAFYSKKNYKVFVADEVVKCLRKARGKVIADKHYRRVLKNIREPQINLVAKNHNIDWKKDLNSKIKEIIKEGIDFRDVLMDDVHKDNTSLTDKKTFINDLAEKKLKIGKLKGVTLEEKIEHLIIHFENLEKDDKVGISREGYEKLLHDIDTTFSSSNKLIKEEFEFQEANVLRSEYLLDFNIKPRDILDLFTEQELKEYCDKYSISKRGNLVLNILGQYKDVENLLIENYSNIAYRNLNELKNNGIEITDAELGDKFEEITKTIFSELGFDVDEKLQKKINTAKAKVDVLLNLGKKDGIIILECKTIKEAGYNKFSSVSRQIKSYIKLVQKNDLFVRKALLIAPEFSEDFEKACREQIEIDLSLITADSLLAIYKGFKESKLDVFPVNLLLKDVVIKEDWILKTITK